MGNTQDRHLHYDEEGKSIYLSGQRKTNQQTKTKYQDIMERYHKALKWEIEHSSNQEEFLKYERYSSNRIKPLPQ